jgi:hypothetical protein
MWVKVDDRFPGHRKVFLAASVLGPHSSGRVIAVWLEAMCWVNSPENLSCDGVMPIEAVRTLRHDRRPLQVMEAMARSWPQPDGSSLAGLWRAVDGGFRPNDYEVYTPTQERRERTSEERKKAGRIGGQRSGEVRRAKLKQFASSNGSKVEANFEANEPAKTNPVPVPQDLEDQEHRAVPARRCAQPVEKSDHEVHRQLCALVRSELDAGHLGESEADDIEHLKSVAGKALIPYDGTRLRKAIDAVLASQGRTSDDLHA